VRRREREVVEPNEIRDIIEACKVCRLGFCEEGEVYIVPVNFGYDMKGKELTLYIHCAGEGRKIDLIRKNAKSVLRWTVTMSWQKETLPVNTVIIMPVSSETGMRKLWKKRTRRKRRSGKSWNIKREKYLTSPK